MVFSFPTILWGLLALAIPIIIHLFAFRRIRKIYFSNIDFIRNVKEDETTRNRLKYLLILASRILLLLFLILAFAQPNFNKKEEVINGSVIYIDNSYSMSQEISPGVTQLDETVTIVADYINQQPLDHEFILLTNEFDGSSNSEKSKEEILEISKAYPVNILMLYHEIGIIFFINFL